MPNPKGKHPGGRPSKYKPAYSQQAYKLCLLGATDKELADFFEVNEDSIYTWKKKFPKFSEAIKKGKEAADAAVAEKLFKRATGYKHPDVDIKVIDGKIVSTKLTKHYPPDTIAGIFWLKNRQKDKWRDKHEVDANVNNRTTIIDTTGEYNPVLSQTGGSQADSG